MKPVPDLRGAERLRRSGAEALELRLRTASRCPMEASCHRFRSPHRGRQGAERRRCAPRGPTTWPPRRLPARSRASPALDPAEVDDVILGCAMPEAEQGLNVARIASLRAGVPHTASAVTVNRFCSSGPAGDRLGRRAHHGRRRAGHRRRRHRVDEPRADGRPQAGAEPDARGRAIPTSISSTGLVAENHARESGISREAQDALRAREPSARGCRHRRGPFRRRDRAGRRSRRSTRRRNRSAHARRSAAPHAALRDRRGTAARHLARGARQAEAGLPRARAASPPATRRRRATARPRPS